MPSVDDFLELFGAFARRDISSALQIGKRVVADERRKGHYQAAHKLLDALEIATSYQELENIGTFSSPTTEPQGPIPDLLVRDTLERAEMPVVSSAVQRLVDDLIREWGQEKELIKQNLRPRRSVLFFGPPGSGKTSLARFISTNLKMPMYLLRFDSLISSFLGETSSNLRKVFDFLSTTRCVLLIDEIDAIAKLRDDRNELGELKRVVISLLQNFDLLQGSSLLIGATNHPHMLDPALWRRFELVVETKNPTSAERISIFERYLSTTISKKLVGLLAAATEGLSGSDVKSISLSASRKALLDSSVGLEESLFLSLLEFHSVIKTISEGGKESALLSKAALALRNILPRKYSFKELEKITGISHSTLHHRSKEVTI